MKASKKLLAMVLVGCLACTGVSAASAAEGRRGLKNGFGKMVGRTV